MTKVSHEGGRLVLTRRGEPVCALVGLRDLQTLEAGASTAAANPSPGAQPEKEFHVDQKIVVQVVPVATTSPMLEVFNELCAAGHVVSISDCSSPARGGYLQVPLEAVKALVERGFAVLGCVGVERPSRVDADWSDLVENCGGLVRFYDHSLRAWLHADSTSPTGWRNTATLQAA